MSDNKATPAEPEPPTLAKLSISADSSKPATNASNGSNPAASTFAPGKFSWADDAETPTTTTADSGKKVEASTAGKTDEGGDVAKAQTDGATTWLRGSEGLDEPEFNVNVKLADLQADPNNPLYSAKSFEDPNLGLKPDIQKALSTMGFVSPSKIQEKALPLLLQQNPTQNLIGQSQSGTGKTAAFVINILQRIDLDSSKPQALVLAPTRELARQIKGVVELMGMFLRPLGLRDVYEAVTGSDRSGIEAQIVVGTPGTVIDLLKRKLLDGRDIKVLTLDEADNMLDMQGMGDQCKRVRQLINRQAQLVLFSATFPPAVLAFAQQFAPHANEITLQVEELTVKGIKQMYLDCMNDEEKYRALVSFYKLMTIASSMIFVKRRDTAAEVERRLNAEGHSVVSLTGALEGPARDAVFEKFRNGEAKVLIATNVLARGIDVQTVTMVVNYDIPETPDGHPDYATYLHRIGRTGRFGRTGAAISLVHDKRSWQSLMSICKHFSVQPEKIDLSNMDEVEKHIKAIMKNQRNAVDVDMS